MGYTDFENMFFPNMGMDNGTLSLSVTNNPFIFTIEVTYNGDNFDNYNDTEYDTRSGTITFRNNCKVSSNSTGFLFTKRETKTWDIECTITDTSKDFSFNITLNLED